jgi:uncharacterized protein (TIGR03437 family)
LCNCLKRVQTPSRAGFVFVALNQDGTPNSHQNPARAGSIVTLFGTGGGHTNPPSVAGEVNPLELRPLVTMPEVQVLYAGPGPGSPTPPIVLPVEFEGAALELVSGVTQINVTLPDAIPPSSFYPPGLLSVAVVSNGALFGYQVVTIWVTAK